MNQDKIRNLAIGCGAGKNTYGEYIFHSDELAAYTAAVEAPLQARIEQLEEALIEYFEMDSIWIEDNDEWSRYVAARNKLFATVGQTPSTWLSEHDKEVEARERERIRQEINNQVVGVK